MSHDGREAQLSESRVRFDIGQGSPLLLIHGLGNWQNWLANLPRLAERHRVIAVDLPGFGQSEPFRGPVSIATSTRSWSYSTRSRSPRRPSSANRWAGS
jgi:pimeloyl-ACP methyl ester carboxylesterase